MSRFRRKFKSSHRGSASAATLVMALLRVAVPLLLIGGVAYWLLNHSGSGEGRVRVSTSLPGAEILIGGVQTGYVSDTTVAVPAGRAIITVRKPNYVSVPEFAVVEVEHGRTNSVRFLLRPAQEVAVKDTFPPLRQVRQEIFSTGEPVRQIPPVSRYHGRRDYTAPLDSRPEAPAPLWNPPQTGATELVPPETPEPGAGATATESVGLISTQITVSSAPEGATIVVNGQRTSHVTPYTLRGLDRGVYAFRVEREGYVSTPDCLTVSLVNDFQRELVAFELTPDASIPRPTLTVSTTPLAAGISVNGRPSGMGKATVDPGFGEHRVEFAAVPGYRTPDPVVVTLTAQEPRAEAVGRYERLTGNAYIAVLPGEGIDRFDGSMLRVYVDNELILDNPQQRFDATLLGRILAGKRLVRVQYGDLQSETYVNLLDGEVCEITFRMETFFSKRKLRLRDKQTVPLEQWRQRAQKLNVLTVT